MVATGSADQRVCTTKDIASVLHRDANIASHLPASAIDQDTEQKPISARDACCFAAAHLEAKGVTNIAICEVQWIAAPVSGYLVDATGKWVIDQAAYTTFRIGITDRDGQTPTESTAGELFVFMAFGKSDAGEAFWYPPPGPDYKPAKNEAVPESALVYEFLLDRAKFQTLSDRYP